jgi:non-ribosomal peptide synthetase component F
MDTKTNFNLASAVHRHSLITPDALAVACQGRSLTYAELAERSARIGACLAARTPDSQRALSHRAWASWPRAASTPVSRR